MDNNVIYQAALVAVGYFLGAIPFGLVLTRLAGLGDVRKIGSGNIGATNVLRTGNKKLAAATLLLDALKGTVAVLIAEWFVPGMGIFAGFAAFIGHLFPVWLGFKGGKGVATYIGVLLGFAPWLALVFAGFWLASAIITRYSSLSALVATLMVPVVDWLSGGNISSAVLAAMTVISWWRHKDNISRLMNGSESKIGKKS